MIRGDSTVDLDEEPHRDRPQELATSHEEPCRENGHLDMVCLCESTRSGWSRRLRMSSRCLVNEGETACSVPRGGPRHERSKFLLRVGLLGRSAFRPETLFTSTPGSEARLECAPERTPGNVSLPESLLKTRAPEGMAMSMRRGKMTMTITPRLHSPRIQTR